MDRIFVHLPAYREPELIPTIKDALKQAEFPERIIFGICRQYHPDDKFDDLSEFKGDKRIKVKDILYKDTQGLPFARAIINEELLEDEEFVLQLDSHHRFVKNWDTTLLKWYYDLVDEGYNPLLTGYLPLYSPHREPKGRDKIPWMPTAASFYPHGTIFIQPVGIPNWEKLDKPQPSRFCSGHFIFGPNKWAREIKHDPDIYFSGEELNLTVRSFTHGYDLFHPHRLIIWHATMREERDGILVWDDQSREGNTMYNDKQITGRAKIRQLLRVEDNGYDLTGYDLGTVRTLRDYEKYAGIHFKKKAFQKYTKEFKFPPNPPIEDEKEWEDSFMFSFYHLVNINNETLNKKDYDFILVAFDDDKGIAVDSEFISDNRLKYFLRDEKVIHYEAMFQTDKNPTTVVYWAHSKERGWVEKQTFKV